MRIVGNAFSYDSMLAASFVADKDGYVVWYNSFYETVLDACNKSGNVEGLKMPLLMPEKIVNGDAILTEEERNSRYNIFSDVEKIDKSPLWRCFLSQSEMKYAVALLQIAMLHKELFLTEKFSIRTGLVPDQIIKKLIEDIKDETAKSIALPDSVDIYANLIFTKVIEDVPAKPEFIMGVKIAPPSGLRSSIGEYLNEYPVKRVDIVTAWRLNVTWRSETEMHVSWQGMQPAFHDATARAELSEEISALREFEVMADIFAALRHKYSREYMSYLGIFSIFDRLITSLKNFKYGEILAESLSSKRKGGLKITVELLSDSLAELKETSAERHDFFRAVTLLRSDKPINEDDFLYVNLPNSEVAMDFLLTQLHRVEVSYSDADKRVYPEITCIGNWHRILIPFKGVLSWIVFELINNIGKYGRKAEDDSLFVSKLTAYQSAEDSGSTHVWLKTSNLLSVAYWGHRECSGPQHIGHNKEDVYLPNDLPNIATQPLCRNCLNIAFSAWCDEETSEKSKYALRKNHETERVPKHSHGLSIMRLFVRNLYRGSLSFDIEDTGNNWIINISISIENTKYS